MLTIHIQHVHQWRLVTQKIGEDRGKINMESMASNYFYANKTISFQKQKPLSGEKAASLNTFIHIVSKQRSVILDLQWF